MKKFCFLLAAVLCLSAFAGCTAAPVPPPDTTDAAADTAAPPEETTAAREPEILQPVEIPSFYETRTVRPTTVTPDIDGEITVEEWGRTADFRLTPGVIKEKRSYCRDYFAGSGRHLQDIRWYCMYDDEYVYLAVKIRDPNEYVTSADVTVEKITRSFSVTLGGSSFRIAPNGEQVESAVGNMCYGYSVKNGTQYYEFAAPRSKVLGLVDGKPGFLGFTEYSTIVSGTRNDSGAAFSSEILTRSTPMFGNEQFTHDVFVLGEGTPAPAPALTVEMVAVPEIGTVTLDGFSLQFSEPTVLDQGPVGDRIWGHYQFPGLTRYTDGTIRAGWTYSRDTIEYKSEKNPNGVNYALSRDNGKTWTLGGTSPAAVENREMPNGKYFAGFAGKGAYKTDYIGKYTPAFSYNGTQLFFAEDIEEIVDKTVTVFEYDPETGKSASFTATVNWPHMSLATMSGGLLYPLTQVFALSARAIVNIDGVLYLPLYCNGFDSFADSREDAVTDACKFYSVYMFRSADSGRTWDLISQLMTDEKITDAAEGLCEPEMTVMPDGSFVMLMRTGSDNPCYITRSTDKGVTWSDPVRFDEIGVMPQLLTLDCGVTLASYGRPTMRFAATDDPTGVTWSDPFDIPVAGGAGQSCFYTDLMALDDHTALFIYTDFMYPNENGVPVKTILVRTVTVIQD